jgi:hypothetical protein
MLYSQSARSAIDALLYKPICILSLIDQPLRYTVHGDSLFLIFLVEARFTNTHAGREALNLADLLSLLTIAENGRPSKVTLCSS